MSLSLRTNGETITASYFNDIKTELEAVSETTSDDFAIGDGTDTTKSITAANGDANEPQLRYNHTLNYWEFTNDGVEYTEIGSGSGSGSLATYETFVADNDDYTDWDNTTGLVNATFTEETTAPLDGDASYLLTNVTGSINEYLYSPAVAVPLRSRGKTNAITFPYSYDGADSDLNIQVYDITNTVLLEDALNIEASSNGNIALTVYIPESCESIKLKITIAVVNNAKKFIFDNLTFTDDPFVYKDLLSTQTYSIVQAGNALTNWAAEIEFTLATATIVNSGDQLIVAEDDSANTRTKFIAQKKCTVNVSFSGVLTNIKKVARIYKEGSISQQGTVTYLASVTAGVSDTIELEAGEFFSVGSSDIITNTADNVRMNFTATAETEHVVHNESGTENTFNAVISGTTITSQSSPSAPAVASVANPSTGNYTITLTSGFFTVAPGASAVCTDSGNAFANILTKTASTITLEVRDSGGVLRARNFDLTLVRQGTDYKNPNAYAVTPLTRTAYVKDVQTQGTAGGTFTQSAWVTRDLTVVEGDSEIVSLSSNQFTLSQGTYEVEASAPAQGAVVRHFAMIYNITDSAVAIEGQNAQSGVDVMTFAPVIGRIEIASPKTFELQHRCQTTVTTNGLGVEMNLTGRDEIYSVVKITKVK